MCKTDRRTQAKRMPAVKAEDKLEGSKGERGSPMNEFHGFDLVAMEIPFDARPLSGDQHFGRLGYTIRSKTGAVICCSIATFYSVFVEQYVFFQNTKIYLIQTLFVSDEDPKFSLGRGMPAETKGIRGDEIRWYQVQHWQLSKGPGELE